MSEPLAEDEEYGGEPCVEGEDYYMDGPYFVFTAAYHLKRGFCCGSGCKHCPYRKGDAPELP